MAVQKPRLLHATHSSGPQSEPQSEPGIGFKLDSGRDATESPLVPTILAWEAMEDLDTELDPQDNKSHGKLVFHVVGTMIARFRPSDCYQRHRDECLG
ncbi:hypothetical protein ACLKA6_015242 [Drosophila palustris]